MHVASLLPSSVFHDAFVQRLNQVCSLSRGLPPQVLFQYLLFLHLLAYELLLQRSLGFFIASIAVNNDLIQ